MHSLEILENSPLFAGLSRSALKEIAAALVAESWPKNRQIMGPAETTAGFHVIVRGRVKITRSNPRDGRELTLWLLGPGDAFDIVSLLDGKPHGVSAWTLDEVQMLSAPMGVFRDWLERFPPLRLAVHRHVADMLRRLTDLAGDLALHDTPTRLAHLLLRHFDTSTSGNSSRANLLRELPQDELASMIGSVRIVVSRALAALRRESIVEIRKGTLRVTDLKRLLRLAEGHIRPAPHRARRGKRAQG